MHGRKPNANAPKNSENSSQIAAQASASGKKQKPKPSKPVASTSVQESSTSASVQASSSNQPSIAKNVKRVNPNNETKNAKKRRKKKKNVAVDEVDIPLRNFKRYIYLFSERLEYIPGDPSLHQYCDTSRTTTLTEFASKPDEVVLALQKIAMSKNKPSLRHALFFYLANLGHHTIPDCSQKVYKAIGQFFKTFDDVALFLKYHCALKGAVMPTTLKKILLTWYLTKGPQEFVDMLKSCPSAHGWTHKDLFKLLHINPESKDIEFLIKATCHNKYNDFPDTKDCCSDIVAYGIYLKALWEYNICEGPEALIQKVRAHPDLINHEVPVVLYKSLPVWVGLLPLMPLSKLLEKIPQLHTLGIIVSNAKKKFYHVACAILDNADNIHKSQVHPVEIFFSWKTCELGKRLDVQREKELKLKLNKLDMADQMLPKRKTNHLTDKITNKLTTFWPKHELVIAYKKALQFSMKNVKPLGASFLICLDLRPHMRKYRVFGSNMHCVDVSFFLTYLLIKTEKSVQVAVFRENDLEFVAFDENIDYDKFVATLNRANPGPIDGSRVFEWAASNNVKFDLFLFIYAKANMLHGLTPVRKSAQENMLQLFSTYRQKHSLNNAKLIMMQLSQLKMNYQQRYDNEPNVLRMAGFDRHTLPIIEAFYRRMFD